MEGKIYLFPPYMYVCIMNICLYPANQLFIYITINSLIFILYYKLIYFILFILFYNPIPLYYAAQEVLVLVIESSFSWFLCPLDIPLSLCFWVFFFSTSLFFVNTIWSKLILCVLALIWQLFSFCTWKMLCLFLLACMVSDKKSAIIQIYVPL